MEPVDDGFMSAALLNSERHLFEIIGMKGFTAIAFYSESAGLLLDGKSPDDGFNGPVLRRVCTITSPRIGAFELGDCAR